MATVIGPTPPGTGVIHEAISLADFSTSPTSTYPRALFTSSTRLMPMSITTAPGFIQDFFTIFGLPTAAIKISASRHFEAISSVLEWAMVTVASAPLEASSIAIGIPTFRDRPITRAVLPAVVIPAQSNMCITPLGVHGIRQSSRAWTRRPRFTG